MISIFNGVRGREERRLEVFFERGAVEVTTDFLVGAPRRRLPRPAPDQEPERLDVDALRDAISRPKASTAATSSCTSTPPRARSCTSSAREQPASPGFADALAAHALVDAAYRSVSEKTAAAVEL